MQSFPKRGQKVLFEDEDHSQELRRKRQEFFTLLAEQEDRQQKK